MVDIPTTNSRKCNSEVHFLNSTIFIFVQTSHKENRSLAHSVPPSVTPSLGRSLGRSRARSLAQSLPWLLGRSLCRSVDRSLGRSLGRSVAHSTTRSLSRPINRSLDVSLARSLSRSGLTHRTTTNRTGRARPVKPFHGLVARRYCAQESTSPDPHLVRPRQALDICRPTQQAAFA